MIADFRVLVLRGNGLGMYVSKVYAIDAQGRFLTYDNFYDHPATHMQDEEEARMNGFDCDGCFEWINPNEYFEYEHRYKAELFYEDK